MNATWTGLAANLIDAMAPETIRFYARFAVRNAFSMSV